MRDKTAAAKLLLDNGWTLDEVLKVLGEKIIVNPAPAPYPVPYPVYPVQPTWYWSPDGSWIWRGTITGDLTGNGSAFTINTRSSSGDDFEAMAAMAQ